MTNAPSRAENVLTASRIGGSSALRLADPLEWVQGELPAPLHHRGGVADHDDRADRVALVPLRADLHRGVDEALDGLRGEPGREAERVPPDLLLRVLGA